MREGDNLEDLALEGRIILKLISRWEGEGRRQLGRPGPRREDNIEINIKVGRRGMTFCGSG